MLTLPHAHGRYRLTERIAQGGMAEIYLAEYRGDGGFSRPLAVKRILPEWTKDPQFIKMLQDEAKLLVKLHHQNIVQVFELGNDNGVFYISMEYVDGVDLRRLLNELRLRGETLPPKFVYWMISDVVRALAFAHSCVGSDGQPLGIVHRDISPQNILIARHGEVKVADFGIAKGRHRDEQTSSGQLKGKFAYMSPEQARGAAIDSRSDLFSVGILFFEMLTGAKLFDGDSDMDVLRKVQEAVIPVGWERDVAPEIRAILRKCLRKNPEDRFQTAEEMLSTLSHYTMKIGCQLFGFEFAPFLERLFPHRYAQKKSTETVVEGEVKVSVESTGVRGKRWLPRIVPAVMAAGVFAMMPHTVVPHAIAMSVVHPIPVATIPQTPPPAPVPVAAAPLPPAEKPPVATHAKGGLSVLVRPWGYVTIPGVMNRRESPVAVSLNEGEYQVRVFHEPTNRWLSARTTIKSNAKATCLASFGESPHISCK